MTNGKKRIKYSYNLVWRFITMKKYILALDQGTTSSRAILFDCSGKKLCLKQKEFTQYYPEPGWVEHEPLEIYSSIISVMTELIIENEICTKDIAAIGITNQRETTVVWDKETGAPVCRAIVWQCRRTADYCEEIKKDEELTAYIKSATGLLPDAYFSATKIKWILDNIPGAREKAETGKLCFGTVDSWLVYKLTGGKEHACDYTNASRTMLFNINTLTWDEKICKALNIPMGILPTVKKSSDYYGEVDLEGVSIPICGIAGDQQASLFGQCCFDKGQAKNTYGTGCFLLMNTGNDCTLSKNGLVTTLAAFTGNKAQYALEGSVFTGGAVIQWLRDELHLISSAAESETLAASVRDSGGVYLVPAFTGLGAPYWDMYARGSLFGITRGTNRAHIARAALEAIAMQSADLLSAMEKDLGTQIDCLRADGGASANSLLMQFQADIMGRSVILGTEQETTALGAAFLAGLYTGVWKSLDDLKASVSTGKEYSPSISHEERESKLRKWHKAIERAREWEKDL